MPSRKVTAEEKKKYVIERVNPVMERLVIECLKTMPEDPMPYMLELLERDDPAPKEVSRGGVPQQPAPAAAPSEAPPGGKAESKGKGKAKGKAPPPPAVGKAPPPKSVAPMPKFMKAPAKPMVWDTFMVLKLQADDGHFEAEAVADFLKSLKEGPDYLAAFNAHGELAATAFVLQLFRKFLASYTEREQEVEVLIQTVGSGRGDSEQVKDGSACRTEEDKQVMRETMMNHAVKSGEPTLGNQWMSVAEAWLKDRSPPDNLTTAVDGFVNDWFDVAFKKGSQGKGMTEEDRKKKEEAAKRKSLLIREEESRRTAHWKGMSSRRVEGFAWSDIRTTMWCSGGMGGAVLVQVGESEAVVLKPLGLTAVQECVAAEVAAGIDVKVAQYRVVAMDQAEYGSMVEALERTPSMLEEHKLQILSTVKKHISVIEFVNGSVLQGLGGQACLKGGGDAVLSGLGSLIALDCLLNNVDRVPAIWSNDGNLSNVMVTSEHVVVGIDQQINAITEPTARDRYFASVKEFVATSQHFRVTDACCGKIRTAVFENTGVELDDSSMQKVLSGAFDTFNRVAERRTELIAALPVMDRKMTAIFGASASDVGLGRLDLYLEFLGMVIGIVADCLEEW